MSAVGSILGLMSAVGSILGLMSAVAAISHQEPPVQSTTVATTLPLYSGDNSEGDAARVGYSFIFVTKTTKDKVTYLPPNSLEPFLNSFKHALIGLLIFETKRRRKLLQSCMQLAFNIWIHISTEIVVRGMAIERNKQVKFRAESREMIRARLDSGVARIIDSRFATLQQRCVVCSSTTQAERQEGQLEQQIERQTPDNEPI